MTGLGLAASEGDYLSFPRFDLYWLATNSDPHATEMGSVESDPAYIYFFRGFELRHCGHISTLLNVSSQLRSLDQPADLFIR